MKPLTCLTRVSNRKDGSVVNNSIDGSACDCMQGFQSISIFFQKNKKNSLLSGIILFTLKCAYSFKENEIFSKIQDSKKVTGNSG